MTLESKYVDVDLSDPCISLKEWNMGYGDLLAAGLFDEEAIDYGGKHRYQIQRWIKRYQIDSDEYRG